MHKNGNNANIGIRGFILWKNKIFQLQNATPVSIEPLDLWFQVQHAPLYTYLTFACKTETLSSLYSHVLLIPLKSSKSKYQVVHEQKFKDLLSGTCQVSVERSMLDLISEVHRFNTHFAIGIFCFHLVNSDGSRIFPRGCANSQKCYYFSNFLLKTAWKWKNLDPRGACVPGAPLRSANGLKPLLPILALSPISSNYEKPAEDLKNVLAVLCESGDNQLIY